MNLIEDIIDSSKHIPLEAYKIMDVHADGRFKTLFHGVDGSKFIDRNVWVKAERRWAGEGGTKYWTGFHVLLTKEDAEKYFKKFTDEKKTRVIVKCHVKNIRPKESSRGLVWLADDMLIS